MPETEVRIFEAPDGSVPLLGWLDGLPLKCYVRIERLQSMGHELRRPEADLLRDGIHELRTKAGRVNYRILYFFHGQMAVISHGLTKEGRVPPREIELALSRKRIYESDPERHTYRE